MRMILLIFFFALLFAHQLMAGDSFRVVFQPERMMVDIPDSSEVPRQLFVENKMLGPLRSKLINSRGEILAQMSLSRGEFFEFPLTITKGEMLQLVPLVPPLQEARLQIGLGDYEIPAKK